MPISLSATEIARYRRDGFLAPVTVMSESEACAYRLRLEQAERRWPVELAGGNRNNPHLCFDFFDELSHLKTVLDAVEDLIGPNILICGTVLFDKAARDSGHVSFHQDVTYMGLEPPDGVSAWIALTPSHTGNGCMRMVPGSHDGLRPHHDTVDDTNLLTRGQTIDDVDANQAVNIELRPGQMSLHSLSTIHDSGPNPSDDRRIGFTIQSYIPPHVRQARGRMHTQLARGLDTEGHHPEVPRVIETMSSVARANRDRVNADWAEILYQGSDQTRRY